MQATASDKFQFYTATILLYACILALVWCVSPVSFFKPDTTVYAAPTVQVVQKPIPQIITGKPIRLQLASVSIDLPVSDGVYDSATGTWTIGNHQAYYATPTIPLNDHGGTTLIYGHNNRTAFRNLRDIPEQAELLVYTDTGYLFHYRYTSVAEVDPTDTSLLTYDGPPAVLLQTCSGNWNEYRKLFQFSLAAVDPPAKTNV